MDWDKFSRSQINRDTEQQQCNHSAGSHVYVIMSPVCKLRIIMHSFIHFTAERLFPIIYPFSHKIMHINRHTDTYIY